MEGNLKKGLMVVFSANIVNLVFNLLTNFLLPKYLSVDSYSAIKTFQLYTTYIGIFGLGAADGMYLRYGGEQLNRVDESVLETGIFSFRILMILESIILIPFSFVLRDKIIIAFTLTILSTNMSSYFKNLYQAVGEFDRYGRILNITTIATFAVNMVLLFVLGTDEYFLYLVGYVIVDAVIWFILEYNFHSLMKGGVYSGHTSFSVKLIVEDIKSGFLLMVGNFSNILLSSMDRWFVKVMMDTAQFAYYSFTVSLEGFLNVAISPITTTLYNYFCSHKEYDDVVRIRKSVLIFGTVIVAAAFPAKFIIQVWLQNYTGAVNVLFILFSTQMIYAVIKGVYVNLYKAVKKQNLYFLRLVSILIIGAVINFVFVNIYFVKEAFAYGTLVSAVIWLLFSIHDFREYVFSFREGACLVLEIFLFNAFGMYFNAILGLVLYVICTISLLLILMREEKMQLLNAVKKVLKFR
ncbi:MAG: hypothetical protein LUF00_00195 [Lachnospiraceae bacterium]|nr:hypothetical protein [Lachnospiraceae bacterium]